MTSIPNHASHIKDMKYALIISITIQNQWPNQYKIQNQIGS